MSCEMNHIAYVLAARSAADAAAARQAVNEAKPDDRKTATELMEAGSRPCTLPAQFTFIRRLHSHLLISNEPFHHHQCLNRRMKTNACMRCVCAPESSATLLGRANEGTNEWATLHGGDVLIAS